MSSILKSGLLAALSLATSSPVLAFDRVSWSWDAAIVETVTKNVDIRIDIAPTDMTMVESLQVHFGNVVATTEVTDITNNQASPGGTAGIDGITIPATDLGSVTSAATAVANNLGVDSDTALQLHIGQFAAGGGSGDGQGPSVAPTGNSNLSVAAFLGSLVLEGALQKAIVRAASTVDSVVNATVESAATAVANNVGVRMAPNGMILADMLQFANADVSAWSSVANVRLANYTGLGSLPSPIVISIATAIANNASFNMRVPALSVQ